MPNDKRVDEIRQDQKPRILRTNDVIQITSFSRSTINKLIAEGKFPEPVTVAGIRTQVWSAAEVFDWCDNVLNVTTGTSHTHTAPIGNTDRPHQQ